jgi:hypothetical protein
MSYKDKKDQANSARNHYLSNKQKIIDRAKKHTKIYRDRNAKFVQEYLKDHPCVDCGESDPIVLEFDHVRGQKRKDVSNLWRSGASIKSLIDEFAKCDIRCANCHRRKTHKELGYLN